MSVAYITPHTDRDDLHNALLRRLLAEYRIAFDDCFKVVIVDDSMWVWIYAKDGPGEPIWIDSKTQEPMYELIWLKPHWDHSPERIHGKQARAFGTYSDELERHRA